MSEEEKKSVFFSINKTPLQSKKFIASMLWSLIWLVLIAIGIFRGQDTELLVSMVYIAGSIQGLYLGGQAFVDALVKRSAVLFDKDSKPE